jgi:hypothetical protein
MNRKPASSKAFHHATNCIFPKEKVLARHAYGLPLERFFIFCGYICNFSKESILQLSQHSIYSFIILYSKKPGFKRRMEIVEHAINMILIIGKSRMCH